MVDTVPEAQVAKPASETEGQVYDRRTLTYAHSLDDRWTSFAIRAIEWMTGKLKILRMVNKFARAHEEYRSPKFLQWPLIG